MAFSAYLQRVQERLNIDSWSPISNQTWDVKEDEQLDLVMRFLKRAASNLQPSLRMVLPGRGLPLLDRGRILAFQLGEFLHYYNKETEELSRKKPECEPIDRSGGMVNPMLFDAFLKCASEGELEEILTFYTQKSKSASVFLGAQPGMTKTSKISDDSNSRAHEDRIQKLEPIKVSEERVPRAPADIKEADVLKAPRSKQALTVHHDLRVPYPYPPTSSALMGHRASDSATYDSALPQGQQLPLVSACPPASGSLTANSKDQMSSLTSSSCPGHTAPPSGSWTYSNVSSTSQAVHPVKRQCPNSGIFTATPRSSLQSAPQIYSQRLYRPSSAKAVGYQQNASQYLSGYVGRPKERGDTNESNDCSHSALSTAMQQLREKQASRQYSTSNHQGLLTRQLKNVNLTSGVLNRLNGPYISSYRLVGSTGGPLKVLQPNIHENATETLTRLSSRTPRISPLKLHLYATAQLQHCSASSLKQWILPDTLHHGPSRNARTLGCAQA